MYCHRRDLIVVVVIDMVGSCASAAKADRRLINARGRCSDLQVLLIRVDKLLSHCHEIPPAWWSCNMGMAAPGRKK